MMKAFDMNTQKNIKDMILRKERASDYWKGQLFFRLFLIYHLKIFS